MSLSFLVQALVASLAGASLFGGVGGEPVRGAPPLSAEPPAPATAPMADFKEEALWDGRHIVPFHALDDPKMVGASEASAFLDDHEYVLGVTIDGESRAYPTRFVWWHHFINDRFTKTGQPVLITYCSVCNTGIAYDPTVDGKALKFDFYGLYNGVATMCDRDTETVWLQVDGRAVKGARAGKHLTQERLLDTTWAQWRLLHPGTLVMSPDTAYTKHYAPRGVAEPRGYPKFPLPFFPATVTRGDKRLPPFDKVLGIAVPDGNATLRRAYPIKSLREAGNVVNDMAGSLPVVAFLEPTTTTAAALSRVLDGRTLTFEARFQPDGTVAFFDKETGTRWNIEGVGQEGPLAGKSMTPVENHLSQWYGWAAYFPQTTIYGRTDPPQPGNPFGQAEQPAQP